MTDAQRSELRGLLRAYFNSEPHTAGYLDARNEVIAYVGSLIAAERERCAKIADEQVEEWEGEDPRAAASDCAAAIRAVEG
jgi:hypothetical protein